MNTAIKDFINPEDPTGQFEFIEKHLAEIKSKNGKINIVGHVPPGGSIRALIKNSNQTKHFLKVMFIILTRQNGKLKCQNNTING